VTSPPPHHLQEPTPGMLIVPMYLQMLGELIDTMGQNRDLHFW
jgi:hypothetical protein